MKKWFSENPIACFLSFAVLIAARDSFSQVFLDQNVDPFFMVFCFFSVTAILAFGYGRFFNFTAIPIQECLKEKLFLGLITCAAFLLTLYGIKLIGASVFSLVEHCLIPISTFLLALKLLKDKASNSMYVGIIVSLLSVVLFLFAINDYDFSDLKKQWVSGIFIAIACSVLTSISSVFQKKLILQNYEPYQVLIVRFTLPSILIFGIVLFRGIEIPGLMTIMKVLIISIIFFSLPLLLLLQGFVRTSMARFSIFNIFIPAFTFFFNSLIFDNELTRWSNVWVLLGTVGIVFGHMIFEWNSIKPFALKLKRHFL